MIAEPDPEVVALCSKLPELTETVDGIRPFNFQDYPPDLLEQRPIFDPFEYVSKLRLNYG